MYNCEKCKNECYKNYGSGRFCSSFCARSFSSFEKRLLTNEKVSKKLTGRKFIERETISKRSCYFCKNQFKPQMQKSLQKFCSMICWQNSIRVAKNEFDNYKLKCKFKFNVYKYPEYFDLLLLKQYGWYSASNKGGNDNGISRDHIYSIKEGFINKIPPEIISHPANCRLVRHKINQKKNTKSDIIISDLKNKIIEFEHQTGFEPVL